MVDFNYPIPAALLSDTCTDASELMMPPVAIQPGKGCLLQIYPASSNSELIRLHKDRTTMGRDPLCDVFIDDKAISRNHAVIEQGESGYSLTDLNSTNGSYVDDELLRGRLPLSGGELIRLGGRILKFMSSMDEEANYHSVVHELMTRDSLTNAFNRSYLIPLVEKAQARCRQGQNQEVSIVLMDIDHFKQINDRYGHLAGDEVLRIFCERIRQELRSGDVLARFGGEEFLIGCFDTRLKEASRLAERVRLAISSAPFQTQEGRIEVTCSIGVASSDGINLATPDELISAADTLLYQAKNSGRNRVQQFDPRDTRVFRKPR